VLELAKFSVTFSVEAVLAARAAGRHTEVTMGMSVMSIVM
jgi:hypothetical protein